MKKIFVFVLVLAMVFSFSACGGTMQEEGKSVEDEIRSDVRSRVMVDVTLSYDIVGVPNITMYLDKVDEDTYEITGKVSVKDKYGDSYTGNYDAVAVVSESGSVSISSCEVGTLYKD